MCILVVEDDFLIRLVLVEELVEAGYEVEEAETGDQAIGLLEGILERVLVLVTDIHMPGEASGIEVAARARHHLPEVPVIFTTGRPDALTSVHHLDNRQVLVRKPYIPSEIVAHIHELLA